MRKEIIGNHTLYLGDCLDILPEIGDVDAVITDPPYGILKHKIESKPPISKICSLVFESLRDNSFFSFFGMMPTIFDWYQSALAAGFSYKEEITWVKRFVTAIYLPIIRQKETILIFRKGHPSFYQTKEDYGDVKMPCYLDGLLKIDAIEREVSYLKRGYRKSSTSRNHYDEIYKNYKSKDEDMNVWGKVNFTNVWSFAPHNHLKYNDEEFNIKHPTVKPILLMERLICLTSIEENIILDPFMGSGTTGVACENTNRKFIGIEIDEKYFDIACKRVEAACKNLKNIPKPTPQLQEAFI